MADYLFQCGYGPPALREYPDDESSLAFFVEADTPEQALSWGCEVAQAFTARLYHQAGISQGADWKADEYAYWLQDSPETHYPTETLQALKKVRWQVMPDFDLWE
jgi:hypothetical protein